MSTDLRKSPEEVIEELKNVPPGPVYRNLQKQLGKVNIDSGKKTEEILHLVESHAVSLRTKAYLKYNQIRCRSNYEQFAESMVDWSSIEHGGKTQQDLLDKLYEMPEEWTLVQLTYSYDPTIRFNATRDALNYRTPSIIHITRFVCGSNAKKQIPYCVRVSIQDKFRMLHSELLSIIGDHEKRLHWKRLSAQQYYKLKGTLDMRMKNVVQQLQKNWLGIWVSLLVGHYVDVDVQYKINSFVESLLKKYSNENTSSILKDEASKDIVHQLTKASPFLSELELSRGLREYINIPEEGIKEMARDLSRFQQAMKLRSARRQPVILLLDEDLEMFPWEMLSIIQNHPVCRVSSFHVLYGLYTAHKQRIKNGKLQVCANSGYYIVNPEQNLPCNEKRLRPFLTQRAPSWEGTFGIAPTSEDFKRVLQNYNIVIYSGHGSGCQFLPGDEIQNLKVNAVTFLFGCSSVTSKNLGGRVEPFGIWHFYHTAGCPMVVGNLWSVTDTSSDAITMCTLNNWLPATEDIENEEPFKTNNWKQEPELLYAIQREQCSLQHYLASASLVFRGLPIIASDSLEKNIT